MMGRTKTWRDGAIFRTGVALGLALFGLSLALPVSAAAKAAAKAAEPPAPQITYDAASVDVDYKTNAMSLKDVIITYGAMTVRADQAHATAKDDFKNSHWTFQGNVRINADPRGTLRSDEAVVEFRDNRLVKATATGNPADFDQKRADSNQVARGHADEIVYDVNDNTVRLSKDAWLSDGQNEITSQVIVYNLLQEHVQAITAPGTGERVHITIGPRGDKTSVTGPNKPPATAPTAPDPGKPDPNKPATPPATAPTAPDRGKPDPNRPATPPATAPTAPVPGKPDPNRPATPHASAPAPSDAPPASPQPAPAPVSPPQP